MSDKEKVLLNIADTSTIYRTLNFSTQRDAEEAQELLRFIYEGLFVGKESPFTTRIVYPN